MQGLHWKEKVKNREGKIVFSLILGFDDYERNNPLGSHKGIGKYGAIYLTVPILLFLMQLK